MPMQGLSFTPDNSWEQKFQVCNNSLSIYLKSLAALRGKKWVTWAAVFCSKVIPLLKNDKSCLYSSESQRIWYWITSMYINTYYHAEDMILCRYVYTSRCKVGSKTDVKVPFPMTSKFSIHTNIYSSNFQEKGKQAFPHMCADAVGE